MYLSDSLVIEKEPQIEGVIGPDISRIEKGCERAMDDDDFVGPDRKISRKRGGVGEAFADINFPQGHCLVHQRWKGTPLAKELDKVMPVHLYDGMVKSQFPPRPP